MSNITIRVSLPGYNALTDTNPDHYALFADADNVLIKEKARGTGTATYGGAAIEISHNLGYIPFYMVQCQVASGRYIWLSPFDVLGGGWKAWVTTSKLYVKNQYSSSYQNFRYYIFYDNMEQSL